MSKQERGRDGQARIGRQWEEQAQGTFVDVRGWRVAHPQASLAAIEEELDRQLEGLRARMLADLALASAAAAVGRRRQEERACCPGCGTPLHDGGVHQRTLVTLGNQKVELVRDYGTCPGCGAGLFPPGRGTGAAGAATLQPTGGTDAGGVGGRDDLWQGGTPVAAADGGGEQCLDGPPADVCRRAGGPGGGGGRTAAPGGRPAPGLPAADLPATEH